MVDRLARAERDVPVAERERAEEEDLDPLRDEQRTVCRNLDGDVGLLEVEALGGGCRRDDERRRSERGRDEGETFSVQDAGGVDCAAGGGVVSNETCGTARSPSSAWKYSRERKLKMPAMMLVGSVSSALS